MKHLVKLIAILLLSPFSCISQGYLPFPTDSAVWYSVYSKPEYDPPPLVWYDTYRYKSKGDTIINNIEYTKLYREFVFGSGSDSYQGAYRVENEYVYFIDDWDNTESLLYDFSLIPGDTILISESDYEPYNLICLDTSTLIINDTQYQSYYIYSYLSNGTECYTTWVKGIGSLRMPIETDVFCAASFESKFDLSCFYYKDEHIYEWIENPYFEGCIGTNVGISEIQLKNPFSISPNPVNTTSQLICNQAYNTLFDYQIVDMKGNIIRNAKNIEVSAIVIQKHQFKKGLYVMRLFAQKDGRFYTIKFIIR